MTVLVSTSFLMLVGVGLQACGVAGAALRCPDLAWYAGAHPRRRSNDIGATLWIGALVVGLAVL